MLDKEEYEKTEQYLEHTFNSKDEIEVKDLLDYIEEEVFTEADRAELKKYVADYGKGDEAYTRYEFISEHLLEEKYREDGSCYIETKQHFAYKIYNDLYYQIDEYYKYNNY